MYAAYLRVSTQEQNLDGQRREMLAWFERRNVSPESILWFEDKQTGKTLQRSGFQALQRAILGGTVDTVVVWKLDRLARSFADGVRTVTDWITRGVRVVSVTQAIDIEGVMGQMIVAVLFAFAEMELAVSKERQAAGIAAARGRGVYRGRALGSTKAKPERARELRDKGLQAGEIAEALGVTERTVWRYLRAGASLPPGRT